MSGPGVGNGGGQPLVSVIIVTWNGRALLEEFMPSVMALDYPNYEVIVMDNASTDGSVEWVETRFPRAKIVRNTRNDGTAEGSNVGARAATGKYLFFISNDMWLDPAILTRMIARMEADDRIGICTVKMRRILADGRRLTELDSVGANVDRFGFPDARGIHQEDQGQFDEFTEVFFSFGGAMLIRRDIFEKTGGYDPAFFTLTDDIDLSWRTRLLGYKVYVEPRSFLYHRVSATLDTPAFKRAYRRFISERNTIRTLLKNYSAGTLLWLLPVDLLVLLCETLFYLVLGRWRLVLSGPRAIWWNIVNLRGTLELRRLVQASRVVDDRAIQARMKGGIEKFRVFADLLLQPRAAHWQGYFGGRRPVAK